MPAPNQPRGGSRPPPVIAAQPLAVPEERVSSVAAAAPAPTPPEPVQAPAAPEQHGSVDLAEAAAALQQVALSAVEPAPSATPKTYVAVVRHFVGGDRGYIEPDEPIAPSAEDLPIMLAQHTIREV